MKKNFIELSEANFDREVLGTLKPVMVEFLAGWSDPCKVLVPMLESPAEDGAAPAKVARVNVEDHELLTAQYGVRSVPTLPLFNQGGVQDQIVGRTTEQAVRTKVELLG